MTDSTTSWHFYDQGLRSFLTKHEDLKKVETFADHLGAVLGVDLFTTGFRIAHFPASFLEGIGLTEIPSGTEIVKSKIIEEIELYPNSIRDVELPHKICKELTTHFKSCQILSIESLIDFAEKEMSHPTNYVVKEIKNTIIRYTLDDLQDPQTRLNYHDVICNYLAHDFTQRFPYDSIIAKMHSNRVKRRESLKQVYHSLFLGAADALKKGINCSYFSAMNHFLNKFSNISEITAKKQRLLFEDPYRKTGVYLHKKDLLDPYLIYSSVCGFHFENKTYSVNSFTLESPEKIKLRAVYAIKILNWINENIKNNFTICPGSIYFFNTDLEVVDVLEIEKIKTVKFINDC